MARKWLTPFLVGMMLLTGVCNTLLSKYQDLQCVAKCDSPNPAKIRRFSQPVIQTAQMFVGEMGCWIVVAAMTLYRKHRQSKTMPLLQGGYGSEDNNHNERYTDQRLSEDEEAIEENIDQLGQSFTSIEPHNPTVKSLPLKHDPHRRLELRGWRVILLALPACCDIVATTFMNAGLLFVAASIYQMTRGALVLFVGLFSVWFLKRKLYLYQWSALFIVVLGVALVGLAGAIAPNPQSQPEPRSVPLSVLQFKTMEVDNDALLTLVGVFMIALAQIFTATQFVFEEHILGKYELQPLKVVGWEGLFGFVVTMLVMIILHLAIGRHEELDQYGYFNAVEGWKQIVNDRVILVTSILIMISIGGFNFFGLSVTRSMSGTARSTIDTCRTLFIWIVSLGLGWESFKWLQIVGFALLVYGTFLFNDLVRPPLKACIRRQNVEERPHEESSEEP